MPSCLERDLREQGIDLPSVTLHRFWAMLANSHGQIWNAAPIASSLGISEPMVRKYLDIFSLTALFILLIACINFMNLATARSAGKAKEVGIRKVVGATVPRISTLLSLEFFKWVVAANLLAWPTAYLIMDRWLQNFARRTGIELWIFALAGGLSILTALVTISFQTIRAARSDPVKSLRYE